MAEKSPNKGQKWSEMTLEEQKKQMQQEEMMKQKMAIRGGQYKPGVMWGISWPGAITGWVVALVVSLLLLSIAGFILGPIITAGLTLETLFAGTAGIVGAFVLLGISFVSYFIGGWVSARIAGFNGILNGFMTVIVGIIVAFVFGIAAAIIAGNIASILNASVPGFLVGNIAGLLNIAGLILLVVQLIGAALGGWVGERSIKAMPAPA